MNDAKMEAILKEGKKKLDEKNAPSSEDEKKRISDLTSEILQNVLMKHGTGQMTVSKEEMVEIMNYLLTEVKDAPLPKLEFLNFWIRTSENLTLASIKNAMSWANNTKIKIVDFGEITGGKAISEKTDKTDKTDKITKIDEQAKIQEAIKPIEIIYNKELAKTRLEAVRERMEENKKNLDILNKKDGGGRVHSVSSLQELKNAENPTDFPALKGIMTRMCEEGDFSQLPDRLYNREEKKLVNAITWYYGQSQEGRNILHEKTYRDNEHRIAHWLAVNSENDGVQKYLQNDDAYPITFKCFILDPKNNYGTRHMTRESGIAGELRYNVAKALKDWYTGHDTEENSYKNVTERYKRELFLRRLVHLRNAAEIYKTYEMYADYDTVEDMLLAEIDAGNPVKKDIFNAMTSHDIHWNRKCQGERDILRNFLNYVWNNGMVRLLSAIYPSRAWIFFTGDGQERILNAVLNRHHFVMNWLNQMDPAIFIHMITSLVNGTLEIPEKWVKKGTTKFELLEEVSGYFTSHIMASSYWTISDAYKAYKEMIKELIKHPEFHEYCFSKQCLLEGTYILGEIQKHFNNFTENKLHRTIVIKAMELFDETKDYDDYDEDGKEIEYKENDDDDDDEENKDEEPHDKKIIEEHDESEEENENAYSDMPPLIPLQPPPKWVHPDNAKVRTAMINGKTEIVSGYFPATATSSRKHGVRVRKGEGKL